MLKIYNLNPLNSHLRDALDLNKVIEILGKMHYSDAIPDIQKIYRESDSTTKNKAAFALLKFEVLSAYDIVKERLLGNLEIYMEQESELESHINQDDLIRLLKLDFPKGGFYMPHAFIPNIHQRLKPQGYNPPVKRLSA